MVKQLLSYLAFLAVMTISIAVSTVVVVCLYLPFVVLKALFLAITGRMRSNVDPADASRSAQHG